MKCRSLWKGHSRAHTTARVWVHVKIGFCFELEFRDRKQENKYFISWGFSERHGWKVSVMTSLSALPSFLVGVASQVLNPWTWPPPFRQRVSCFLERLLFIVKLFDVYTGQKVTFSLSFWVVRTYWTYHIYQPLRSGRTWRKVNF